ncbi:hypothetical protein LV779_22635 [Streptomyces thinghirensis]|nr:hypothetical protein [Streptomyces thinghirensis]
MAYTPPKKEGVCDVCGGELYQRGRRLRGDGPQAARGSTTLQTEPIIDYYKARAAFCHDLRDGEGGGRHEAEPYPGAIRFVTACLEGSPHRQRPLLLLGTPKKCSAEEVWPSKLEQSPRSDDSTEREQPSLLRRKRHPSLASHAASGRGGRRIHQVSLALSGR